MWQLFGFTHSLRLTLCFGLLLLSLVDQNNLRIGTTAERLQLEVTEPAGIRRRGYPVSLRLQLPRPVSLATKFRLLHHSKLVAAQFRPATSNGNTDLWWLDFPTELLPHETRTYDVEYGAKIVAGPERLRGHQLIERENVFIVSNEPYINWTIPRNLNGLLQSVDFPPAEHLQPNSLGLVVRDRTGAEHVLDGKAQVIRQGTEAVALQFDSQEHPAQRDSISWTVQLLFPSPVSWVEVMLKIEDPDNQISEVGLQLQLNLDAPTTSQPTLVDLGAASTVYTSLTGDAEIELRGAPLTQRSPRVPWQVLRGPAGQLTPFVLAPEITNGATPIVAEGWAHIMDRKRCLAIAFDRFAESTTDRIHVTAKGAFTMWRRYPDTLQRVHEKAKTLRSWLHFVHYPPQYSAGASPQAMQNPIQVRQLP